MIDVMIGLVVVMLYFVQQELGKIREVLERMQGGKNDRS
jgi:hypothetical protein